METVRFKAQILRRGRKQIAIALHRKIVAKI